MPHKVQIAFENADLELNHAWFALHWPIYSQAMGAHALMSYPVFEWNGFKQWLPVSFWFAGHHLARFLEYHTPLSVGNNTCLTPQFKGSA